MKIKLLFVLLVSLSSVTIYSSDVRDQVSSIADRICHYRIGREDFNFIDNSVEELKSLNLPSRLEGKLIFLGIKRVAATNMSIRTGIAQYVENDVIVIDEMYRDNDDVGKILRNMGKYFWDQPEHELIELLMQDLAVGASNCKFWQIN